MDNGVKKRAGIAVLIVIGVIVVSLLILFGVLFLGGLFITKLAETPREERNDYAEKNAVSYIENKYGFTPKVVSSSVVKESTGPFSSTKTDNCEVHMKNGSKRFTVIIPCVSKSDNGYDNYQYQEILDDYKKFLEEKFDTKIAYIDLDMYTDIPGYSKKTQCTHNLYKNKNFSEVIKHGFLTSVVYDNKDEIYDYMKSLDNEFGVDGMFYEVDINGFVNESRYKEITKSEMNFPDYYYLNFRITRNSRETDLKEYKEIKTDIGLIKYEDVEYERFSYKKISDKCYHITYDTPVERNNKTLYVYISKKDFNIKYEQDYHYTVSGEKRNIDTIYGNKTVSHFRSIIYSKDQEYDLCLVKN